MRTTNLGIAIALTAIALTAMAAHAGGAERADVVREWSADGTPTDGGTTIGWSKLKRRDNSLRAKVRVDGLVPGGIYTFWWVVPHALPPEIPFDVFVAHGGSAIADADGGVKVKMRATKDQPGIEGFPPLGDLEWHPLTDTRDTVVRVEIAYHGQAMDAGAELATWLSDFWTGSACPADPETPQGAAQPHCPVSFAATHLP